LVKRITRANLAWFWQRLREWWARKGRAMARIRILTAILEPEEAFAGTRGTVSTSFGNLDVVGNRLKLLSTARLLKGVPLGEEFDVTLHLLEAFLSTLAFVTDIGVGHAFYDYVDYVDEAGVFWTTTLSDREGEQKVDSNGLSSAEELLPLVMSDLHLRWALQDYRIALGERDHELIFLYRSIEWLKVRFDGWEKAWQAIGSSKKQFEAIKKPANSYYLTRHALRGGPRPVPPQVLDDAFKNTRKILQKYVNYLRSQAVKAT